LAEAGTDGDGGDEETNLGRGKAQVFHKEGGENAQAGKIQETDYMNQPKDPYDYPAVIARRDILHEPLPRFFRIVLYPYPNLGPKGNTFFPKVYGLKYLQPETTSHILAVIAGRKRNGAGSRDILWKG
jgi:hypothetical protein